MNAPVAPYGRVLAPYGRILERRLISRSSWPHWAGTSPDGQHVTIWVGAGDRGAWSWAAAEVERRLLLVAPTDKDPAGFNWSVLCDHAPVIVAPFDDPPSEFIERLVVAILRDGCARVLIGLSYGLVRYTRRSATA
jgi:hypothetical protein